MKKTLFSLAFVAASGVYVAVANHVLPLPRADAELTGQSASPADPSSVTPASATPLVAPQPSSSELAPIVAEIAPLPAPVPSEPAPSVMTNLAPPPPLPRARPTAPAVSVQPVAATSVAAGSSGGYRDGTYTGSSENAYYGRVRVQVTIANHVAVSVKVLDFPSDRRTSRHINSRALPILQQEVIAADGANVDTVSGATLTSEAYRRSLETALQQAGAAGA